MAKTYFGFAIADSMFVGVFEITRCALTAAEARDLIMRGAEPCVNPSHAATIAAMRSRFGIDVEIPETPPRVVLSARDAIVVMGVRGLPRLTDRHEYTKEEIAQATFSFSVYTVISCA